MLESTANKDSFQFLSFMEPVVDALLTILTYYQITQLLVWILVHRESRFSLFKRYRTKLTKIYSNRIEGENNSTNFIEQMKDACKWCGRLLKNIALFILSVAMLIGYLMKLAYLFCLEIPNFFMIHWNIYPWMIEDYGKAIDGLSEILNDNMIQHDEREEVKQFKKTLEDAIKLLQEVKGEIETKGRLSYNIYDCVRVGMNTDQMTRKQAINFESSLKIIQEVLKSDVTEEVKTLQEKLNNLKSNDMGILKNIGWVDSVVQVHEEVAENKIEPKPVVLVYYLADDGEKYAVKKDWHEDKPQHDFLKECYGKIEVSNGHQKIDVYQIHTGLHVSMSGAIEGVVGRIMADLKDFKGKEYKAKVTGKNDYDQPNQLCFIAKGVISRKILHRAVEKIVHSDAYKEVFGQIKLKIFFDEKPIDHSIGARFLQNYLHIDDQNFSWFRKTINFTLSFFGGWDIGFEKEKALWESESPQSMSSHALLENPVCSSEIHSSTRDIENQREVSWKSVQHKICPNIDLIKKL